MFCRSECDTSNTKMCDLSLNFGFSEVDTYIYRRKFDKINSGVIGLNKTISM